MSDPPSPRPLRLALLGAGTFAASAHKTQLLRLVRTASVHIHLVWSRSSAAAESLAIEYGPLVFAAHHDPSKHADPLQSAKSALRAHHQHLDAVILAVPIPQLASFAQLVLEQRLHLLQEKPLAQDLASASRLLSVSVPRGIVHAVAENYRFENVFRRARCVVPEVCKSVIALRLTAQTPMPVGSRYGKGWRLTLPGVGVILDGMVHHIAGMRILLGADVENVMTTCSRRGTTFTGCDTVSGTLTFSNNIPANIFVTYVCSTFMWELRVVGTDGDIVIRRNSGKPGYVLSLLTPSTAGSVTKETEIPFSGLDSEFEAFVDSCIIGKVHPGLDALQAFNDLATVQAMFESSHEGRVVSVSPMPQRSS